MNVSLEYLERCTAETGFQIDSLEKVTRLGEMASDIARHPFLGDVLALKGGTALNLCFGPPARLSVDLDFNYIGHLEREKMLADRPKVEQAVEEVARRHGYRVQRSADAFAGRKLYLIYTSVLGQDARVEIDLNFLFRAPLVGTETREMWQPGELDRPHLRLVSLDELCAGKLIALLQRTAARDIWDVARLAITADKTLASPLFRARLIALSAILDHPLTSYNRKILEARVTEQTIAKQLVPMLIANDKPQAEDLFDRAWSILAKFLDMEQTEMEYIEAIHRGELRPELLFPDDADQADRIARHPAILWKIQNVQRYLAR